MTHFAIHTYLYFEVYRHFPSELAVRAFYKAEFIAAAVLIGETIIYWFIRKWPVRKLFVWVHIASLYFIIVGLPLVNIVIVFAVVGHTDDDTRKMVFNARYITYWSLVIIGHISFIAAIVDGIRNKKKPEETELFDSI